MDDIISGDDELRLTLTKLERNFKKINSGHHQFQMGITKMMLKFACQNLPSKSSTGMSQTGLAFGTSMTLLFTKNKMLATLISSLSQIIFV